MGPCSFGRASETRTENATRTGLWSSLCGRRAGLVSRRWPTSVRLMKRLAKVSGTRRMGVRRSCSATFTVQLKAGKTRMQTWLTKGKGVARGAYYVYVKRL